MDARPTILAQTLTPLCLPEGILCLIGISTTDTAYESQWLATKLLGLKIFPEDKEGEAWGWKSSVVDAQYEILCGTIPRSPGRAQRALILTRFCIRLVSQFTLQANLRKGSKPDFHGAKAKQPPVSPLDAMTGSSLYRLLQGGDDARHMYHDFLEDLRTKYQADKVFDGQVSRPRSWLHRELCTN